MRTEEFYALLNGAKANRGEGYEMISDRLTQQVTITLLPNRLYVYSAGISALNLSFGAPLEDTSSEYRIIFKTGAATPGVTLPNTVVFAPAEPVFAANRWYELSFVPLGNKFTGVWTYTQI